jgi:hypothetical protein
MIVERRDQVLITVRFSEERAFLCLLQQVAVDERAFPDRTGHVSWLLLAFRVTATDDQTIRCLVLAGLRTAGFLTPWRHWVTAT